MRTTSLLISLLYAVTASANIGFGIVGAEDQLPTTDEDLSVPGANPLYYCSSPENDILVIENVDLDPNPPEA